jgi:hypothetical protein
MVNGRCISDKASTDLITQQITPRSQSKRSSLEGGHPLCDELSGYLSLLVKQGETKVLPDFLNIHTVAPEAKKQTLGHQVLASNDLV